MADFSAWIPYVNRPDLLLKAVESIAVYGKARTIIDNSPHGLPTDDWNHWNGVYVQRPPVPLSCSQTFNLIMKQTRYARQKICIWMHSDAEAGAGVAERFLDYVCNLGERKWGVVFTNYDTLSALNADATSVVGEWDVNLPQYWSDVDMYRRIRLAGWECVDSPFTDVKHYGSVTINNSRLRLFMRDRTVPLSKQYFIQKWGGDTGREIYDTPFNLSPDEWNDINNG